MGVFNDSTKPPKIKAGYGTAKKAHNTLRRLRRGATRKKAQQVARTMYRLNLMLRWRLRRPLTLIPHGTTVRSTISTKQPA